MTVEFTKMHGAGNDFVLIDNRDRALCLTPPLVARLCDRRRGVGADGVLLLAPSATGQADCAWEFYNRDGTAASMCGNGARCFARFVRRLTHSERDLTFETGAGLITASFAGDRVTVTLTRPEGLRLHEELRLGGRGAVAHSLNTGVPHAVVYVPELSDELVETVGPAVRSHPRYGPEGTNVNFVEVLAHDAIRVRTYERGVEGETLACGTGVTAAALISARLHGLDSPVRVATHGGDTLEVSFQFVAGGFDTVRLNGPAEFVFDGRITL